MKLRVTELSKKQKLTLRDLANEMGIAYSTLTNILSKGNPTLETLSRMADALGVPITELFEKPTLRCPVCGAELELRQKEGE